MQGEDYIDSCFSHLPGSLLWWIRIAACTTIEFCCFSSDLHEYAQNKDYDLGFHRLFRGVYRSLAIELMQLTRSLAMPIILSSPWSYSAPCLLRWPDYSSLWSYAMNFKVAIPTSSREPPHALHLFSQLPAGLFKYRCFPKALHGWCSTFNLILSRVGGGDGASERQVSHCHNRQTIGSLDYSAKTNFHHQTDVRTESKFF